MKLFQRKERNGAGFSGAVPKHIAIIMDGNGRWAKKRGLPRSAGHSAGSNTFRNIATFAESIGVEYLTVYAFSTENWKRPKDEVDAIMGLLVKYLHEAIDEIKKGKVRLKFFGDVTVLSDELRSLIDEAETLSKRNAGMQANICLNYGGRDELVRACRALAREASENGLDPDSIDEQMVSDHLFSAGIPDPELVIRPGGEHRSSNFLMWQSSYSEFYFTDVLWPDFTKNDLLKAIEYFNSRDRRFGGVKNQ